MNYITLDHTVWGWERQSKDICLGKLKNGNALQGGETVVAKPNKLFAAIIT